MDNHLDDLGKLGYSLNQQKPLKNPKGAYQMQNISLKLDRDGNMYTSLTGLLYLIEHDYLLDGSIVTGIRSDLEATYRYKKTRNTFKLELLDDIEDDVFEFISFSLDVVYFIEARDLVIETEELESYDMPYLTSASTDLFDVPEQNTYAYDSDFEVYILSENGEDVDDEELLDLVLDQLEAMDLLPSPAPQKRPKSAHAIPPAKKQPLVPEKYSIDECIYMDDLLVSVFDVLTKKD